QQKFSRAAATARRDRGSAADGAALLQRRSAQPQYRHPVVSRRAAGAPLRIPGGAVLRARRPRASGCPAGLAWSPVMIARVVLALAVLLSMLVPAGAVERILDFISDVTVERNGDLNVTETIAVQAEGQ